VHDYQSIEIAASLSNSNILDLPPQCPDRTNIKPLHSSTPTRKAGPPKCASPIKIVNINFQSIKPKLCRLSNVIDSIKPDIIIGKNRRAIFSIGKTGTVKTIVLEEEYF
jgi:hypothetical protein